MENSSSVESLHGDTTQNSKSCSCQTVVCGICLDEVSSASMHILSKCKCTFCQNCLRKYFQFMIDNGHFRIYCPSFKCMLNNVITKQEISAFISSEHNQKFQVLLSNKVLNECLEQDQSKIRCPFCDQVFEVNVQESSEEITPTMPIQAVKCPNCLELFCANCHLKLPNTTAKHSCNDLSETILNEFDIKKCPSCNYLIQREGGCAQISCRNCSHVFCWHCLKSLDNDFLLFHYDSGPCKNRLGHSRLSIFFNRVQTITICLGISILMILASPIILIMLPCLLTSKCRVCCRRRKDSQV